jgi:hypothetical protein
MTAGGELARRIDGLQNQITMTVDRRNHHHPGEPCGQDRAGDLRRYPLQGQAGPQRPAADHRDIKVFEDHIDIQLKADIDSILRCAALPEAPEEDPVNFNSGMEDSLHVTLVQAAERPGQVFHVNGHQ